MPGTSIDNIDYKNEDNAATIDAVMQEVEETDQQIQVAPPPQYQPPQQYQQPPQQYQQPPQQYQMGPPQYQIQQPYYPRENFEQSKQMSFSFTLPDSLKKTLILLVLLLLINNSSFKNILTKIPMTVNGEGKHTFMMTLIIAIIISIIFFITSSVF